FKRELKGDGKEPVSRYLYVFVSARIVDPSSPAAAPAPGPALTLVPGKSDAAASLRDEEENVPAALAGPGGFVRSPFAPDAGLIDVRGFAPGTKIRCPYSGKIFKTP